MKIDFEKLLNENIGLYGTDDKYKEELLKEQYSSKSHFIYELMQNAEDVKAEIIQFHLYQDHIDIFHDGEEFTYDDVYSITRLSRTTKDNSKNNIGKFGIGFKSVFAYTDEPEIYCQNDVHFCLKNYIKPYKIDKINILEDYTTLFRINFNNDNKSQSFKEIKEELNNLSSITLLFLNSLETIEFHCEDEKGLISYSRQNEIWEKGLEKIFLYRHDNNNNYIADEFLLFTKFISDKIKRIQIAFKVQPDNKNKIIVPINDSKVFVYFPTAEESHLGYYINANFITTPNRETIKKNNPTNKEIIEYFSSFIIEVLQKLKDKKLISVSLLSTIIKKPDYYPDDKWLFSPFYENILELLKKEEYIPTYDGTLISSQNAKLARNDSLRKLLPHEILTSLFGGSNCNWVTDEISESKTNVLYKFFKNEMGVEEIRPENFIQKINKAFFEKQTDEWILDFYNFVMTDTNWLNRIRNNYKQNDSENFINKEIIRLQDNNHIEPYEKGRLNEPKAFIYNEGKEKLTYVKQSISDSEIGRKFLEGIGYKIPDLIDSIISNILPKYTDRLENVPDSYDEDLKLIKRAYDSGNQLEKLINSLKNKYWLLGENAQTKEKKLCKYADVRLCNKETELFYEGNNNIYLIRTNHKIFDKFDLIDIGISINYIKSDYDIIEFTKEDINLNKIYSINKIQCYKYYDNYSSEHYEKDWIICARFSYSNPFHYNNVIIRDERGKHQRGKNGFVTKCSIDGLEFALQNITIEKSKFLWNKILSNHKHLIKGKIEKSSRQDFSNFREFFEDSEISVLLNKYKWLPDKDGNFNFPQNMEFENLHSEFEKDEELAKQLGVKLPFNLEQSTLVIKTLVTAGLLQESSANLTNVLNENPEFNGFTAEEMKIIFTDALQKKKDKSNHNNDFPKNPRKSNSISNIDSDNKGGEKVYVTKQRSTKESKPKYDPKPLLKDYYTNDNGKLICQMCEKEMPFKLPDNEYYFEAVEFIDISKDISDFYIGLCPICAAKYKNIIKKEPLAMENIRNLIKKLDITNDILEISFDIKKNGKHKLRFIQEHIKNIQSHL